MKPAEKSPKVRRLMDELVGGSTEKSILENYCVLCREKVEEFKDELSAREFAISGLCQKCQDEVFGV